jgi:hypothetical protein
MLKKVPRATFHDNLPDLINFLENIPKITDINNRSTIFQIIANRVAELRAIVTRANNLLNHDEPYVDGVSTIIVISTYSREIALPENRHDNDKINIIKVKILSIKNEIRNDYMEFLLSIDSNQSYFLADPAERHLNIYFRLLRHDIFGKLKQIFSELIIIIENYPALLNNIKFNFGNIRIYPYLKAHIRYISYDQRQNLEI